MKSRISLNILVSLQNSLLVLISCIEQYPVETIFKDIHESLTNDAQMEETNHHVYDRMFNHLGKLCIL